MNEPLLEGGEDSCFPPAIPYLPAWHRDTLGSCLQTFFSAFFFLLFVSLELSHFHVQQE